MTGKRTFLIIKRDEKNREYIAEVKHSDYYPSPERPQLSENRRNSK